MRGTNTDEKTPTNVQTNGSLGNYSRLLKGRPVKQGDFGWIRCIRLGRREENDERVLGTREGILYTRTPPGNKGFTPTILVMQHNENKFPKYFASFLQLKVEV